MSDPTDLDMLWAVQDKAFDDAARRGIAERAEVIKQVFFKPPAARPPIPEPMGKTDLYLLRRQQGGWIDPRSNSMADGIVFMVMAGLIAAGVAGLLLLGK